MGEYKEFAIKLKMVIDKHGREIYVNEKKFKGFLMDYFPKQSKERNLIITAVKNGVGKLLIEADKQNADLSFNKAINILEHNLFIDENAARLAVYCIGYSLDLCDITKIEVVESEHVASTENIHKTPSTTEFPSIQQSPVEQAPESTQSGESKIWDNKKLILSVICVILAVIVCFVAFNIMGINKQEKGKVGYVPPNAVGIPVYAEDSVFANHIKYLKQNTEFSILEKKDCTQNAYVLKGSYSLKDWPSYENIIGNKTIIFTIDSEAVGGAIIRYFDGSRERKAYIACSPSNIARVGDSIRGSKLYKIKLQDGTVGWIYSGFVQANVSDVDYSEGSLNDYIIEKEKYGKELKDMFSKVTHWHDHALISDDGVKGAALTSRSELQALKDRYEQKYKGKSDYSDTLYKIFVKQLALYEVVLDIDKTDRITREQKINEFERLYDEYLILEHMLKKERK